MSELTAQSTMIAPQQAGEHRNHAGALQHQKQTGTLDVETVTQIQQQFQDLGIDTYAVMSALVAASLTDSTQPQFLSNLYHFALECKSGFMQLAKEMCVKITEHYRANENSRIEVSDNVDNDLIPEVPETHVSTKDGLVPGPYTGMAYLVNLYQKLVRSGTPTETIKAYNDKVTHYVKTISDPFDLEHLTVNEETRVKTLLQDALAKAKKGDFMTANVEELFSQGSLVVVSAKTQDQITVQLKHLRGLVRIKLNAGHDNTYEIAPLKNQKTWNKVVSTMKKKGLLPGLEFKPGSTVYVYPKYKRSFLDQSGKVAAVPTKNAYGYYQMNIGIEKTATIKGNGVGFAW